MDGAGRSDGAARLKMAAAFEFIEKLGVPFYCFHDVDLAPSGGSFREFRSNLDALVDDALGYQERTGARLLGAPRTCSATPATRRARRQTPILKYLPTRPRRSRTCSRSQNASAERTTSSGRP